MTGADFSGVDIDLLADYVGGALDGTPDEAVVTALIAEDAAWRAAHAMLRDGVAAVTDHLQDIGSAAEPMPADVFARLDAALLAETTGAAGSPFREPADLARADSASRTSIDSTVTAGGSTSGELAAGPDSGSLDGGTLSGVGGTPAEGEPGTDGAAPARHLVAVPSYGPGRDGSRGAGSRGRRARRLRWAAPVGIAAGVLAFVGFGVQQFGASDASQDTSAAGSAADNAARSPGAETQALTLPSGTVQISNTGNNYRRDTLGQVGISTLAEQAPRAAGSSSFKQAPATAERAAGDDPALDRLRVQQALQECIDAIAAQQGAGEITAQTVDFARFEGMPAVVVQFTAAGATWVWAAGPDCGAPEVGADKLAAVQVG